MTNLSPISFQSTNKIQAKTPNKQNKESNIQATPTVGNTFPKSLLALAMLGAATLQSCVMTETLDEIEKTGYIEETQQLPEKLSSRFSNMLDTLGLFTGDNKSIHDIKTISFSSDNGDRHYLQPKKITANEILMNQLILHSNCTGTESKVLIKKNDTGIDVTNIVGKDSIKAKYVMTNDGIAEYKSLNGIFVENSRISKREDGTIVQKFANGDIKTFSEILNNESMPAPIEFDDASVKEWSHDDKNIGV